MCIISFFNKIFQNTCEFKFSLIPDDNWWIRFQALNKFISAVQRIIFKVRLVKILAVFKTLKLSDLVYT